MDDLRNEVLQRIERWSHLGRRTVPSGAVQIGRVPHVAPLAWLHDVFAPITETEQKVLVEKVPQYANSGLRDIHHAFNGIDLFSSYYYLYGQRANYIRSVDNVLPWDLATPNAENKAKLRPGEIIVGGSNALYHGCSFVESREGPVTAVDDRDWSPLFTWPTLRECLSAELERLTFLFDTNGKAVDKAALADFGLRRS